MTRTKSIPTHVRTCLEYPCSRTIPADSDELRCAGCKGKQAATQPGEGTAAYAYARRLTSARETAARIVAKLAVAKPWAGGEPTWTDVSDLRRVDDALAGVVAALGGVS